MKDKSKILAIGLVILTIIVVVISSINKTNDGNEKNNINIVTNYSNFYTVSSCLYRTVTHISNKDIESLYLILDDNYKKENKIDENSVIDLFPEIEPNSTFSARKMYYQLIGNNITKYYVFGYLEKEELYENGYTSEDNRKNVYFIVYLDNKNKTFSIEPYGGELFIGGDLDE